MSDTTEAIQPDVMEATDAAPEQPGTDMVPALPHTQAAVQHATTPGVSELVVMKRQAEMLAGSDIIPKAYRNQPANILVAAMTGRNYGWDPLTAMRNGHVIEGVWTLRPEAMIALARKAGHSISGSTSSKGATVTGRRADTGDEMTFSFSVEDAVRAGLCTMRDGRPYSRSSTGALKPWEQYPHAMCWARAVAQLCRMLFSDVLLGISYTPEELGADVNEHGEVIDVDEVVPALTVGDQWQGPQGQTQAQATTQQRQDQPADPAELWQLQERIEALPEGAKADLRKAWTGQDSRVRGVPARAVPRRLLGTAKALVNAHWAKAKAAGVDMDAELADVRATEVRMALGALHLALIGPVAAPEQPLSGPVAASEPFPAPNHPDTDQGEHSEPQGSDTDEPAEQSEPAVDWRPALVALAEEVRGLGAGVPNAVIERIGGEVQAMHWSHVNTELASAELADTYPPESPIDLRRMAVCAVRLRAFRDSGVVPGGTDG